MKKTIIILVSALMPIIAGAQAQINTKKVKIADFPEKVTKVVFSGNEFFDLALQDEVSARWRVSPYEFCTLEEFESIKTDENYYFLLTTKTQFKRESAPGFLFMSLVKGGKEAEDGIGEMLEVASMPIASAEDPSGREFVFLPAFIDIIQNHAMLSIESDVVGYAGLYHYTENIKESSDKRIVIAECDLACNADKAKDIYITDEESADQLMAEMAPNTLVSLTIAPADASNGSYCYKMLIDSQTHALYYYRRHRITRKDGPGFLDEDIKKISSFR